MSSKTQRVPRRTYDVVPPPPSELPPQTSYSSRRSSASHRDSRDYGDSRDRRRNSRESRDRDPRGYDRPRDRYDDRERRGRDNRSSSSSSSSYRRGSGGSSQSDSYRHDPPPSSYSSSSSASRPPASRDSSSSSSARDTGYRSSSGSTAPPPVSTTSSSRPEIYDPYAVHAPSTQPAPRPPVSYIMGQEPHVPEIPHDMMNSLWKSDQEAAARAEQEEMRRREEKEARERREREAAERKAQEVERRRQRKAEEQRLLSLPIIHPEESLLKKPSEFLVSVRYRNRLPDLPFEAKFVDYPIDSSSLSKYRATSLEFQHRRPLLTEPDMGVFIDLVDPELYRRGEVKLHPDDAELLRDETSKAPRQSRFHNTRSASWLRKTEYMTGSFGSERMYGVKKGKADEKLLELKAKRMRDQMALDTTNVEGHLQRVEDSFLQARLPPVHPTDPTAVPVQILPVFPAFELAGNNYIRVMFGVDPSPQPVDPNDPNAEQRLAEQRALCDRALLQPLHTDDNKNFAPYSVPVSLLASASRKRKRLDANPENDPDGLDSLFGDSEEENDDESTSANDDLTYSVVREYKYERPVPSEGRDYAFVFTDDAVVYHPVHASLRVVRQPRQYTTHDKVKLVPPESTLESAPEAMEESDEQ